MLALSDSSREASPAAADSGGGRKQQFGVVTAVMTEATSKIAKNNANGMYNRRQFGIAIIALTPSSF